MVPRWNAYCSQVTVHMCLKCRSKSYFSATIAVAVVVAHKAQSHDIQPSNNRSRCLKTQIYVLFCRHVFTFRSKFCDEHFLFSHLNYKRNYGGCCWHHSFLSPTGFFSSHFSVYSRSSSVAHAFWLYVAMWFVSCRFKCMFILHLYISSLLSLSFFVSICVCFFSCMKHCLFTPISFSSSPLFSPISHGLSFTVHPAVAICVPTFSCRDIRFYIFTILHLLPSLLAFPYLAFYIRCVVLFWNLLRRI